MDGIDGLRPYESPKAKLRLESVMLANMRGRLKELRELLERVNGHWVYEDGMYRFYYQSFKVFPLQQETTEIVTELAALAPEGRAFGEYFEQIIRAGTGCVFTCETNSRWIEETGPIVQAFLHARYFLEMAVKYAELEAPPQPMPSGYAALLCLYGLR
jgi:hypothetical protein